MAQVALITEEPLLFLGSLEDAMGAECVAENLEQEAQALREKVQEILNEHIRAGIFSEGPFRIVEDVTTRRLVDIGKLKELFPEVFQRVVKQKFTASVGDVEKILSEHELTDVITVHETRKNRLDWDYRGRVET
jgi:hypothetical protein